jgi:hypothetical protein
MVQPLEKEDGKEALGSSTLSAFVGFRSQFTFEPGLY